MQVREAVQTAKGYLPVVFESAEGQDLRLEGIEKTDNGQSWTVTFSYFLGDSAKGAYSPREFKTIKLRDNDGDFVGARNGALLSQL